MLCEEEFIIFDYNKIAKNADKLTTSKSSGRVIFEALKLLFFDKRCVKRRIIFTLLEGMIALHIAYDLNTISVVKDIFGYIGQIQVGLIGVVFTGYALFQALIGDQLMLYLLTSDGDGDKKSKLEESNESFIYLIIVQIIVVLIDFLAYIIMSAMVENWCLTSINILNILIAAILIAVMLYMNIESIWELKSFIFNVYQLFNAHAVSRVVDIISKQKEKDNNLSKIVEKQNK